MSSDLSLYSEKKRQRVEAMLASKGVHFHGLPRKEAFRVQREWLARFASNVKEQKKKWVFLDYMWHGFSYEMQPCKAGTRARAAYAAQELEEFCVFDEGARHGYACTSSSWPDFSDLHDELYVFPKSMRWTMVFTHELSLGPYFAEALT